MRVAGFKKLKCHADPIILTSSLGKEIRKISDLGQKVLHSPALRCRLIDFNFKSVKMRKIRIDSDIYLFWR
jgi:hypothetical protein